MDPHIPDLDPRSPDLDPGSPEHTVLPPTTAIRDDSAATDVLALDLDLSGEQQWMGQARQLVLDALQAHGPSALTTTRSPRTH